MNCDSWPINQDSSGRLADRGCSSSPFPLAISYREPPDHDWCLCCHPVGIAAVRHAFPASVVRAVGGIRCVVVRQPFVEWCIIPMGVGPERATAT